MSGFQTGAGHGRVATFPGDWRALRSRALARAWWLWMLRGTAALAFGGITFVAPHLALRSLLLVFAVYLIVDGIFAVGASIRAGVHHGRWLWLLLEGLAGIIVGLWIVRLPVLAITVSVWIMAAWALVSGALMIAAALGLNRGHGNWLLGLGGLISIIWGALLALYPIAGALVLTIWLGAYAAVFGMAMIAFGWQLRRRNTPTMV